MSFETTQQELESLFSEVGQIIQVSLPADRQTGRPRGFAFVEFTEAAAATEAIERFDGYRLEGRSLRVSAAEERPRYAPNYSDAGLSARPRRPKGSKPKGSRRNIRSRKRSL